jgi:hypothetical protein
MTTNPNPTIHALLQVEAAASVAAAEDELFDDVPEEFLDPMLYTLMVGQQQ